MKIAFSTSGENLDAPLDVRFGRAARFLVLDLEKNTFALIDNTQNLNAAQGAGIQAAENVVRAGADCLVSGHCGPKAFRVLQAAGIKIYNCDATTINEALEQFKTGRLQAAASADVEGHW